jgi:hypothetical protein
MNASSLSAGVESLIQAVRRNILRSTGFEFVGHLRFDEVVPHLPHAIVQRHMAREVVRNHAFSGPSVRHHSHNRA